MAGLCNGQSYGETVYRMETCSSVVHMYYEFIANVWLTDTKQLSRLMTKPTKWHVRPAKTQISLGIRPVWSESSLSAWRKLGSLATHWAHSEDSDQTGRMPRLIWVFAGHTCHYWFCHEVAQLLYKHVTKWINHIVIYMWHNILNPCNLP